MKNTPRGEVEANTMPAKRTTDPGHLAAYRAKRSLERTPEPAGVVGRESGQLFVVHQHAARRLHFDLRLEMEGVLRSWAVPKGPSYDTAEKRLAVHVEDHPLEYGDFEGLIPKGNYGAGAVIVWDRGRWKPVGDPLEGLATGKLLFELHGYKLHGLWTLVKLKKSEKDWLLIKERDAWASADPPPLPDPGEHDAAPAALEKGSRNPHCPLPPVAPRRVAAPDARPARTSPSARRISRRPSTTRSSRSPIAKAT